METLWTSSSRLFSANPRERETVISISLREILGRNEIRFFSSPKQIGITFSNSIDMETRKRRNNKRVFLSPFSSASATQDTLPDEQAQIEDTSKTVRVKFHLQRRCSFGEHFLLLGDDTMFGSWDPLAAIPLEWSEGDIWTTELDIPIGKAIQYKFILKEITGDVSWQPGADRVIQTWETTKVISVFEDWENAELQMVLEQELVAKNNEDPEMKTVAENGTESSMHIVAESMANPVKDPAMNINKKATSGENITHANEPPVHDSNNGGPMAFKKLEAIENEVSYEGVPVLVPGLTPVATTDTEDKSSPESNDHTVNDSSSRAEKFKEHSQTEEEHCDTIAIKYDSTDQKGQGLKQIETVYENSIRWGRTTLQKLLSSFGL